MLPLRTQLNQYYVMLWPQQLNALPRNYWVEVRMAQITTLPVTHLGEFVHPIPAPIVSLAHHAERPAFKEMSHHMGIIGLYHQVEIGAIKTKNATNYNSGILIID